MSNLVIEQTDNGARYCRSVSNDRILLQNKLLEYYGFKLNDNMMSLVFPSGMCSINAIFNISSTNGKTIFLIGDELYCDTSKVCKYQTRYNKEFNYEQVDVRDTNKIIELFNKYNNDLKLFFIESSTNPSGQIFDFDKITELKKLAPNCIFVVDNTWITGCSFNPFDYGADIVVESMTKYISGGECIGGMMIGKKEIMDKVLEYVRINGLYIGKDHCQIFLKGLETIKDRISYTSKLANEIANYLEKRKEITRVMYPMLESHPTNNMAKKYLKYGPGVIWFHMASKIKKLSMVHKLLSSNTFLSYETSFGSAHSKIDQWPEIGKSCIYNYNDLSNKTNGIWIRLSIGYKSDMDTIIKGLDEIFINNIN